jgi:hypothetical protein
MIKKQTSLFNHIINQQKQFTMKTIYAVIVLVLFLYSCTTVKTTGRSRTSKVEINSAPKPEKV